MLFLKLQLLLHLGWRTRVMFAGEDTLMGSLAALPCPLWRVWVGNMESSVSSCILLIKQKFFSPLLRARGREVPLMELWQSAKKRWEHSRKLMWLSETEIHRGRRWGIPRERERQEGWHGEQWTQKGTESGTWEPKRNRSTHTQNVKLHEARPSVLGAQMASDPQRLKVDF